MWGGGVILPPCWFPHNNSEKVKDVTFCKIRDFRANFGISNLLQSPDIGQNSDGGISYFWISGQSLIKENRHNSRTSDDIDMKLEPVTKVHKRNKITSKYDDDVMFKNYDVIVIFIIHGQFGAIQKPDSGRIVCKTYFFINSNLLSYTN